MPHYRLRTKTVAVPEEDSDGSPAIFVPSGTVLKVPDDLANATGFVEVEWDGKRIQMFARDLRERAELTTPLSA